MTPFELWIRMKPSLRHLHIWGYPAKAGFYNPLEKKLDSKIVRGYFIGYLEKSKGYRFYYPNHSMSRNRKCRYLENDKIDGNDALRNVIIQKSLNACPNIHNFNGNCYFSYCRTV